LRRNAPHAKDRQPARRNRPWGLVVIRRDLLSGKQERDDETPAGTSNNHIELTAADQ